MKKWFVRGDWDGFFGLLIDNVIQLMLIFVMGRAVCGFSTAFIAGRILPGVAISVLAGNLFYAWQARELDKRNGRRTVTALPFGINTIGLLAFMFLVMGPVYYETNDPDLAWKAGLAACILSGVIECLGAFVGDWLKKNTPRAALLSALGGVALAFMVLGFSFQIFAWPVVAMVPMMLLFVFYGAEVRLPLRLPGGLVAVGFGVAAAWVFKWLGLSNFVTPDPSMAPGAFHLPKPAIAEIYQALTHSSGWMFLSVALPVGFLNVIGSIENLESAEAAGDKFKTKPSLMVNGLTSLLAGALGSPFPTTIYVGHPGWKAMGARSGYSVLNGVVIAFLCLVGGLPTLLSLVPIEAAVGMLIWVGVVNVAQAFQESKREHAIAVVVGLIPPLAAWALHLMETVLRTMGMSLYEIMDQFGAQLYLHGVISLYQGFLLSATLLSAIVASAIDRNFRVAAVWSFVAAGLSAVGLIHAYELTPAGVKNIFGWMVAPEYFAAYALLGLVLTMLSFTRGRPSQPTLE